ncbi:unnamed protein product [Allacma fusca]|uniref:VPS37 C-terminal domain-containing protein n=1 Tax=Allacma fusca TaxID=39272 RepID=A0A8J2PA15_9HEXA|nr:unnamed protein product [Allacma fusca]
MMQLPDAEIEQSLQSLQNLSVAELQNFLDDEDTFNAFVNELDSVREWESDKDVQVASNKSLAEYNLSLEPVLKDAKAALWELYERARATADEVETKRAVLGTKRFA